jgi:hypothetical protein
LFRSQALSRASGRHHRRAASRLTFGAAAAAVVTVAGVSAGVAFAATGGPPAPPGGAPAGPGGSHAGLPEAGSSPVAAASGRATRDRAAGQPAGSAAGARSPAAVSKTGRGSVPAAQHTGQAHAATHPGGPQRQRAPAGRKPAHDYEFYDSVEPGSIPAGAEVATYLNVPASAVAGRKHVLWIDIFGSDPKAEVIDVEPGCASPSAVPGWVRSRLTDVPGSLAIVYTTIGEWSSVQQDVSTLPAAMRARIRWWIADPTGYPHIVPGSQATQWDWGSSYDISTALPSF